MKRTLLTSISLVFLLFLLPVLASDGQLHVSPAAPSASLPPAETAVPSDSAFTLRLLQSDGTVTTLTMAEYLPGVVAAEMPAAFQPAALQAQAVAARTYACARCSAPSSAHPDADLCTDYSCCQAYRTAEERQTAWGENAASYEDKVSSAVSSTDGQVILYDGQPIRAVFFSSASGSTSAAEEVWGSQVPYLSSVSTPEGDEVPNFRTTLSLTPSEFSATFLAQYPQAELNGSPSSWFSAPEYASSGCTSALTVGGVRVSGRDLRTLFSLRSSRFTVSATDSAVTFSVVGYGHGVGMSQYGANSMAKAGSSYEDILTHYYTGVTLGPYPAES